MAHSRTSTANPPLLPALVETQLGERAPCRGGHRARDAVEEVAGGGESRWGPGGEREGGGCGELGRVVGRAVVGQAVRGAGGQSGLGQLLRVQDWWVGKVVNGR